MFRLKIILTDVNLLNLFKPLADMILANENTVTAEDVDRKENSSAKLIAAKHKNIFCKMEPITCERFYEMIVRNAKRFDKSLPNEKDAYYHDVENVINALCHPRTVRGACELYLQQIRDCNSKQ